MRLLLTFFILLYSALMHADTIDNYMKIANNIPAMEMKADPQAQAWARSAHHVLNITSESIAETLIQANNIATQQGAPIFCLTKGSELTPARMNSLIQQTYKNLSSQQSDKNNMTVSQMAFLAVRKQYPCQGANRVARVQQVIPRM